MENPTDIERIVADQLAIDVSTVRSRQDLIALAIAEIEHLREGYALRGKLIRELLDPAEFYVAEQRRRFDSHPACRSEWEVYEAAIARAKREIADA